MMYGNRFWENGACFGNGFFGGGHILMMVLVIALIIAVVIWLKKRHSPSGDSQALNILKDNFVRGTITEEEYLSRKNVLTRK